ncbi:MAG: hypothetical protein U9Q23_04660 [Candidatus Bipolaricaulota bacterium]|nr:hypothetical protein [Candidatus Bipolaricaulota bacterium]
MRKGWFLIVFFTAVLILAMLPMASVSADEDQLHLGIFADLHAHDSEPSWAYVTLNPAARTIEIKGAGDQIDLQLEY